MVVQNALQHKIGVSASLQQLISQCGMGPHKAHLLDNERILFFYVILQDNLSDVVENARFCKLIANFFFIPQFPRKIVSQITHFHAVDELFGQGISQHVKLLTGFFFHFGRYFSIPIRFLSIISSIRST